MEYSELWHMNMAGWRPDPSDNCITFVPCDVDGALTISSAYKYSGVISHEENSQMAQKGAPSEVERIPVSYGEFVGLRANTQRKPTMESSICASGGCTRIMCISILRITVLLSTLTDIELLLIGCWVRLRSGRPIELQPLEWLAPLAEEVYLSFGTASQLLELGDNYIV